MNKIFYFVDKCFLYFVYVVGIFFGCIVVIVFFCVEEMDDNDSFCKGFINLGL